MVTINGNIFLYEKVISLLAWSNLAVIIALITVPINCAVIIWQVDVRSEKLYINTEYK
jgi:hypothetical protein